MTTAGKFERRNLRLPTDRYRGRNLHFVTLCFYDRRRFGEKPRVASWLIASLQKHAAICAFTIHAYCFMPDHMHLLAAATSDESNLIKFVEFFKQETAFEFARRAHRRLWQFKYFDRVLRASDSADRVAWYIWLNPVRKGLCLTLADYPFLGSFSELGKKLLRKSDVAEWIPPWKMTNPKAAALKTAALRPNLGRSVESHA